MRRGLAAVVAAVALLAACGGSSSEKSDSATTVKEVTKNGTVARCGRVDRCAVGDTGATGGKVIAYWSTNFKCWTGMTGSCNFLEIAPSNWGGVAFASLLASKSDYSPQCSVPANGIDIACKYFKVNKVLPTGTLADLGASQVNADVLSKIQTSFTDALPPTSLAYRHAVTSATIPNQGTNFVPSLKELVLLCNYANNTPLRTDVCVPSNVRVGFQRDWYWSSTVSTDPGQPIWAVNFATGEIAKKDRSLSLFVRPVRSFLSVLDTSIPTTLPTLPPTTLPATSVPRTTLPPTTIATTTTAPTCANGGACSVGNTGPGGGSIVYVNAAGFKCGAALDRTCKYLEAASESWSAPAQEGCQGSGTDMTCPWQFGTTFANLSTATAIGTGAKNTAAMYAASPRAAAATVRLYNGGGKTDWFIPSFDEANEFCKWAHFGSSGQTVGDPSVPCKISFHRTFFYNKPTVMTSSESTTGNVMSYLINATASTGPLVKDLSKSTSYMVWPMRAF